MSSTSATFPVKFIHTPGHTPGSQCFLVEGNLISGDTLFVEFLRPRGSSRL